MFGFLSYKRKENGTGCPSKELIDQLGNLPWRIGDRHAYCSVNMFMCDCFCFLAPKLHSEGHREG